MQSTSCLLPYHIQINLCFEYYHMQIFTVQNSACDLEGILNI